MTTLDAIEKVSTLATRVDRMPDREITARRGVVRRTAAALAIFVVAAFAGHADAFVYWAESATSTIARANTDGSGLNITFMSGLNKPGAMAIDSTHIYWLTAAGSIARANLDGSGINLNFIPGAFAEGVAADGAHIYWTTSGPNGSFIRRANLDGTGVAPNFITAIVAPTGIAVDGAHVYWTYSGLNTIGRANLDGSSPNHTFIKGAANPQGIAVDGGYIYWVNGNSGTIGRANLDGTSPNQSFILAGKAEWVAVDAANIWWTNGSPFYAIGRASLNGANINQRFIDTLSASTGIAVNALAAPAPGPGASPPTIARAVDDVHALGLPRGTERSLLAKLAAAQSSVDAGLVQAACGSLAAYVHEVDAQAQHTLDDGQAADLIADAIAIRERLGCGAS